METNNNRFKKKYEKNPFAIDLVKEIKTVQKRRWVGQSTATGQKGVENQIVINQNGEEIAETRLLSIKKVDEAQFTKIYANKLKSIWDMPSCATRVFEYITTILKPNQDEFYFDEKEALKHTKYRTRKSLWQGFRWLNKNGFVASSSRPYIYFINPTIFFNGDRLIIAEAYMKASKDELKQAQDPTLFD